MSAIKRVNILGLYTLFNFLNDTLWNGSKKAFKCVAWCVGYYMSCFKKMNYIQHHFVLFISTRFLQALEFKQVIMVSPVILTNKKSLQF